jgi:hypothetical protein
MQKAVIQDTLWVGYVYALQDVKFLCHVKKYTNNISMTHLSSPAAMFKTGEGILLWETDIVSDDLTKQ